MTTTPSPIRILIADDHDVMREGTRAVIERQPGWEVCGVASTGREAVTQAGELAPDIVIMDMSMPDLNGLDAAVQIKRRLPRTEILMFTAHETDELIREVFEAGVKSFIFKSEAHHFLVEAIQSLSRHKPFFTSKVSEILFSNILNRGEGSREATTPGQRLSAREREIVQLIAEGKSNKEVADALGISARTAKRIAPASCASSVLTPSPAWSVTPSATRSSRRKGNGRLCVMVACRTCGAPISASAERCQSCGYRVIRVAPWAACWCVLAFAASHACEASRRAELYALLAGSGSSNDFTGPGGGSPREPKNEGRGDSRIKVGHLFCSRDRGGFFSPALRRGRW